MSRRFLWASVLAGTALSLAVTWLIATQRLVIGSAEGGWVYRYVDGFNLRFLESFLIAAVLVSAGLAAAWPWLRTIDQAAAHGGSRLREWTIIALWCVLALGPQALLRSPGSFSAGEIFANDASNSFYTVALKYDAATILRGFEQLRAGWPLHAQSNLPGKLLLVRALTHISTSAAILAWLVVTLSNLGGVLLYFFVRGLFKDRFLAVLSLVLYLFMPARIFFMPLLNIITPVIVLACGCLLLKWLESGSLIYAAGLGAALYGLVLFEPTALIVGVLFAAILMRAAVQGRIALSKTVVQIGAGIVAFAAIYFLMVVWFGFNAVHALRSIAADAVKFNVIAHRPYEIWIGRNLVEFALGAGLCQIVLLFAALADGLGGTRLPQSGSMTIALLCAAILAMLGLADFIGVNRGEVIRLWIFLGCFWQIPAAYVCWRLDSRPALTLVLIATLLQDAVGMSMVGFVIPG
jgi:hypothetical protein